MTRTSALPTLLAFCALSACSSATPSAVQTAAVGHAPTFELQVQDDADPPGATCFRGRVSSSGALGGPLDAATIEVACGAISSKTTSDSSGAFRVCVDRDDRAAAARVRCRMSYARTGFVTHAKEVSLEATRRDHEDAWLDAAPSP